MMSSSRSVRLQSNTAVDLMRDTCASFSTISDMNTLTTTAISQGNTALDAFNKRCKGVQVHAQQVENRKRGALSAAMSPHLKGKRAAVWVEQWDHGSRAVRLRILEAFRILHSTSNVTGIEKDLGDSSILLFTRITAWFRLTCKLCYEIRPVLLAISMFVRDVRYLTYFVEIGGLPTLIDTLATRVFSVEDRHETLLLLRFVANAGRVYREMLCEENGVTLLFQIMQREENSEILDCLANLFLVLGEEGSRSLSNQVQMGLVELVLTEGASAESKLRAARTLRSFQLTWDRVYAETIAREMLDDDGTVPVVGMEPNDSASDAQMLLKGLFSLLYHDDVRLRVEGTELLTMVAKNIEFTGPILTRCFDVVDEDCLTIEDIENPNAALIVKRHQISFGSTAVNIMLIDSNCEMRNKIVLDITARRSAHFTLLKYMRHLETGHTSLVVDCCRVLQLLCRKALAQKKESLGSDSESGMGVLSLEKACSYICRVVGDDLYNVLLYGELTGDKVLTIASAVAAFDLHM